MSLWSIRLSIVIFVALLVLPAAYAAQSAGGQDAGLSGLWFDPALDGEGYNIIVSPIGTVILDLERRCEYNFWQARKIGSVWHASMPQNISMDGNGIFPGGVSSRGSGFPFLGGVIWPDELAAGKIEHVLAVSYPFTKSGGPVAPATASDGITNSASAIPVGARIVLDPALDLDSLSLQPFERTIAEALQVYGMYLVDTGGDTGIGLYAVDPRSVVGNPYEGLLPDVDFPLLGNIPLDRLQVLNFGPQISNSNEIASVDDGPCSAFERVGR